MTFYGIGKWISVGIPDMFHDHAARDDIAFMSEHKLKKTELFTGEVYSNTVSGDFLFIAV